MLKEKRPNTGTLCHKRQQMQVNTKDYLVDSNTNTPAKLVISQRLTISIWQLYGTKPNLSMLLVTVI